MKNYTWNITELLVSLFHGEEVEFNWDVDGNGPSYHFQRDGEVHIWNSGHESYHQKDVRPHGKWKNIFVEDWEFVNQVLETVDKLKEAKANISKHTWVQMGGDVGVANTIWDWLTIQSEILEKKETKNENQ